MREGLFPTVMGTAVTATGLAMRSMNPIIGWGVAGFGLAQVMMGAIDMVQHAPNEQ